MYGEEWDCDEDAESYYEGKAEGAMMFTEEQHKALDSLLKEAKDSIIEDLKKGSKDQFERDTKELIEFKTNKSKLEKDLQEKETRTHKLDYEIRNREYDISCKEKEAAKKEKELQGNYNKAIEEYAYNAENVLKELLKGKLGKALKNFTFSKFYEVDNNYVIQEKCSLCDENRNRHFTDDQGKTYEIDCPCNNKHYVYTVIDAKIELSLGIIPSNLDDTDSIEEVLTKSIDIKFHRDCYSFPNFFKKCFNSKIETVEEYRGRLGYSAECFTSIEDAQLYADYKQRIEDEKKKRNYTDLQLNELLIDLED